MERGVNTSEFWILIAYGAAVLINGTNYINVPWEEMAALGLAVGVYAGGRSFRKAKAQS